MISRRHFLQATLPLIASAAAPAAFAAVSQESEFSAQKTTFSMGTMIFLQVYAPTQEKADLWLGKADDEMNRLASLMTVHEADSPLLEVIRHSGTDVEVPPEVAEVVEDSIVVARESDGAFEPTIGKLVDVWKIGFGGKTVPSEAAIREALKYVDWRKIRVTRRDGKCYIYIAPGQDIDMGGIAKGYIGTKMTDFLSGLGMKRGLLNLGGNVVLIGSAPGNRPWKIGLQHPLEERNGFFAVVSAENESVITSGAYERKLQTHGKTYGHILSPVTGYPVTTDLSSVTIVDKDGAKADAWCTALFAMGKKKSLELLSRRPDLEAILMSADCKAVYMTPGIAKRCTITEPSVIERTVLVRG